MPLYPPFNLPFFYNNYRYPRTPIGPNNSIQKKETIKLPKYEKVPATADYNYDSRQKASEEYYNTKQRASEECFNEQKQKASENPEISEASEAFFEIFGLKLFFDDILIMCILFFLYTEKVHNDELFICLILLLLT